MSKKKERKHVWHQSNMAYGLRTKSIEDADMYTHGGNHSNETVVRSTDETGQWFFSQRTNRWVRRFKKGNETRYEVAIIKLDNSKPMGYVVDKKQKMPPGARAVDEYNRCKSIFHARDLEVVRSMPSAVAPPEPREEETKEEAMPTLKETAVAAAKVLTTGEVPKPTPPVRVIPAGSTGVMPVDPKVAAELNGSSGDDADDTLVRLRRALKESGQEDLLRELVNKGMLAPREVVIVELEVPEGLTIDEIKRILHAHDMDVVSIVPG